MKSLIIYSIIIALFMGLVGCDPYVEDKSDLGSPPNPSFTITQDSTPNDFILTNTTIGGFITQWDLGDLGTKNGQEVAVNFPFKGTYDITMTTFSEGGHASLTQSVEVTEDDPNACNGPIAILTGCSEKAWRIAPEEGALHIGPNLGETWWGNSAGDITERSCHWNDLYIFSSDGTFTFDQQGDFWADDDGNGNVFPPALAPLTVGCHTSDEWPEAYSAWDSGVYTFNLTAESLTVIGEGAWIGLYKVGTTDEVAEPQQSVQYSISELTEDRLVIFADYGWGVWRFTLIPA